MKFPFFIAESLKKVHPSWYPVLEEALHAVVLKNGSYLSELEKEDFLPTQNRLFAAFSQPMHKVRYILVGEGPYPRKDSATGYCFMDGAVESIWSENGFSKAVNRATSLRNFLKMLLVADRALHPDDTGSKAVADMILARKKEGFPYILKLGDLQKALLDQGFLLLNAALVFRKDVLPAKEALAWRPFIQTVLNALADHAVQLQKSLPVLVLWGKMARELSNVESISRFPQVVSEHPYNLSFIGNPDMQDLFGKMKLLDKEKK